MPFTTWIRDLLGMRKDYVETEKAVLEIEKLEDEKRARNLITPVTLDDVRKYDPKAQTLHDRHAQEREREKALWREKGRRDGAYQKRQDEKGWHGGTGRGEGCLVSLLLIVLLATTLLILMHF